MALTKLQAAIEENDLDKIRQSTAKSDIQNALAYVFFDSENAPIMDQALIQLLLEHDAKVNTKDECGDTPLHMVLWNESNCDKAIVQLLLEKGAKVNIQYGWRETPLHSAVNNSGNCAKAIVQLLLEHGAKVDVKEGPEGRTPLHDAVSNSAKAIVQLLLEHDAKVNVQSDDGSYTPLDIAVRNSGKSAEALVQLLIKKGAKVNTKDECGDTPLHMAARNGDNCAEAIVQLLLEKGAKVNAKNKDGNTPLDIAVRDSGDCDDAIVQLLLEHGAKVNAKNEHGKTPLHAAASNKGKSAEAIVKLLLEHGTELDLFNLFALFDRQQPDAYEAECMLLGSLILDGRMIGDAILALAGGDDFCQLGHALIYNALVALCDQNSSTDLVCLKQHLEDRNELDKIGGIDYLTTLAEPIFSPVNVLGYAKIVHEKAVLRNLIKAASNALDPTKAVTQLLRKQ